MKGWSRWYRIYSVYIFLASLCQPYLWWIQPWALYKVCNKLNSPGSPITMSLSAPKRWEHLFLESLARLYRMFTPPDPKIPTLGDPLMPLNSRWAPTEDGSEHLCGERRCLHFPSAEQCLLWGGPRSRNEGLEPPSCPTTSPQRPLISKGDFRNICSALEGHWSNGCKALFSPALLINAVKA